MLDEMSWPSSSILWTTIFLFMLHFMFFYNGCSGLCFCNSKSWQNFKHFLGYFINHKPLFSEECSYEFQIHHYYLTSCVNYHHSQKCFAIFFGKYYMWYLISHTSLIIGIMWEELHDKP